MSERYKEITAFIPTWKDKPRAQVIEEIASYSLETKRIPDPYYFIIGKDKKLISPQTGVFIEDSVEKDSVIGKKEFEAFEKIQRWATENESGIVIWISPPHSERSSDTKIIISEIAGEDKTKLLFNRAVLLDIDTEHCLKIANTILDDDTGDVFSEEDLTQPLFLSGDQKVEWALLIGLHPDAARAFYMIQKGDDLREKEMALKAAVPIYESFLTREVGYDDHLVREEVERAIGSGVFGMSSASCPPPIGTSFEVFYSHSHQTDGLKFVKNCGNCGRGINKLIKKGYQCKCGGAYKGC